MQFAKLAGGDEKPAYFAGKKAVAEKPSHRSIVVIAQFARFDSDARTKCRQARTRNSILGTHEIGRDRISWHGNCLNFFLGNRPRRQEFALLTCRARQFCALRSIRADERRFHHSCHRWRLCRWRAGDILTELRQELNTISNDNTSC